MLAWIMCLCQKGAKHGVWTFVLFFWENWVLLDLCSGRIICLFPRAHACMLVYSWAHLCSETGSFSGMFSPGCVFMRQCKQNSAHFSTFHDLWSFSTILTGPAPSNASLLLCVVQNNVSCCPQCCKNAHLLSCATWISCADGLSLKWRAFLKSQCVERV